MLSQWCCSSVSLDGYSVKTMAEFMRNSKGTVIKKCCASCKYKEVGPSEDVRICNYGGKKATVTKGFYCYDWEISDYIDGIQTKGYNLLNNIVDNGI